MFKQMEEFKSGLTAGWEEATSTEDKVANTKVVVQQIQEAQKAMTKVVAVVAKASGISHVVEASLLGEEIADVASRYSSASVVLALSIELIAQLDILVGVCEEGIKVEEAKVNN